METAETFRSSIGGPSLAAPGQACLSTLDGAKEVAKAATGVTTAARIEPPTHSPHVCHPVIHPAIQTPRWMTTPSRY